VVAGLRTVALEQIDRPQQYDSLDRKLSQEGLVVDPATRRIVCTKTSGGHVRLFSLAQFVVFLSAAERNFSLPGLHFPLQTFLGIQRFLDACLRDQDFEF